MGKDGTISASPKEQGDIMYCNQCGKQIPDGSRFCNFCGANLTAIQSAPQPAPVQSDPYFDIRHGVLVKYNGRETDVVVPAGVVQIEFNAFTEYNLNSIVIPEGCKKVEIKSHIGMIRFPTTIEYFSVSAGKAFFAPGTKRIEGEFRSISTHETFLPDIHIPSSVESIPETFFIRFQWGWNTNSWEYCADHLYIDNINDFTPAMRRDILKYQRKCRYCGGEFKKVLLLGEKCQSCGKIKDYDSRWTDNMSTRPNYKNRRR